MSSTLTAVSSLLSLSLSPSLSLFPTKATHQSSFILAMCDEAFATTHVDELIDQMLTQDRMFDVALPFLVPREKLEESGKLKPYKSALEDLKESEMAVVDDQPMTHEQPSKTVRLEEKVSFEFSKG
jgi:hypothetical protein